MVFKHHTTCIRLIDSSQDIHVNAGVVESRIDECCVSTFANGKVGRFATVGCLLDGLEYNGVAFKLTFEANGVFMLGKREDGQIQAVDRHKWEQRHYCYIVFGLVFQLQM